MEKPSPLSEKFDLEYFNSILSGTGTEKLSAKAVLATKQRIPGLGNGTLQDILFNAGIHPQKKHHLLLNRTIRIFSTQSKIHYMKCMRSEAETLKKICSETPAPTKQK